MYYPILTKADFRHHAIDRLEETGVDNGSARLSSLKQRERTGVMRDVVERLENI